ncbi:NmrA/HSCARG family protein [Kaarinaea lacus]
MTTKKIIAVVGATGAQGGGLARAILNDPGSEFVVRAITRNTNSDKAKELAKLGAELFAADIDNEASITKAFEGAYGAYCVTPFWEHFSPEKEMAEAANMASAAEKADVKHVVWSTLEDTRNWIPLSDDRMPTLMGKYKVPHFDAKGESNKVFRDLGVPTTFLQTSFYWDNLINFGMGPKKDADGNLEFALPMGEKKLAGMASEDIGKTAYAIFKKGQELIGKTVSVAGEHLTGAQMAEALTEALGKSVNYKAIPFDVYRNLGFPGAEDLGNMFQFYHDFEQDFCGTRNLKAARALHPEMQTFSDWLANNKQRIPIE